MKDARSWQDAAHRQDASTTHNEGGPLRLFQPSPSGAGLSPRMTLAEFYREFYVPVVEIARGNSRDTHDQNQTAIDLWTAHSGNPPLEAIDQFCCARFVQALYEAPKIRSRTTVGKHAAAVQKILRYAGPPSGRDWRAVGLIERVPFVERPPKEQVRLQEPFTLDELEKLVTHTHLLTRPGKLSVSAERFWQALFVLLYNTGMRIQETIFTEWRDVEGDVLRVRSVHRKGGRRSHKVELTDTARLALEWMEGVDPVRVFPWPRTWGSKENLFTAFREYRQRLLPPHRAGIAFHGFRRLHNVELARINERACAKALGHGPAVNARDYIDRQLVREAVCQLKQPHTSRQRQLALF